MNDVIPHEELPKKYGFGMFCFHNVVNDNIIKPIN